MSTILLVILILLLVGALPNFQLHSYGHTPAGIIGVILVILIVLLLLGRI